jgi:hypothetical protein
LGRDRGVLFGHTSAVSAVGQVSPSGGLLIVLVMGRPYRVNYERSIKKCDICGNFFVTNCVYCGTNGLALPVGGLGEASFRGGCRRGYGSVVADESAWANVEDG